VDPQEKAQEINAGSESLREGELMKRRFRWWLSALLLYLLSVPIIFILIGLLTLIFAFIVGYFNQFSSFLFYAWMMFMFYIGAPLSILSSIFVPPFVLGWLRKRRLRRLRRTRR
jgi:uncharacterized membrane protein